MTKWVNVTRRAPCPICGKPDWCSRSDDGAAVACRRVAGTIPPRIDRAGTEYWIHHLNGRRPSTIELPTVPSAPRAEARILDRVYRAWLEALSLSPKHGEQLRRRGLSDETIDGYTFRTLPVRGRADLARQLVEQCGADVCAGIPGLYVHEEDGRQWWSLAGAAGLLIPVRDAAGLIVALRVRRDDPRENESRYSYVSSSKHGGPSPGCPVSVPLYAGDWSLARVTEGELKAIVATERTGIPTLATPGISVWRPVFPVLEALQVQTVRFAPDADARRNRHVARAVRQAAAEIRRKGYGFELETWDEACGKGIDDMLAAGYVPDLLTGDTIDAAVAEMTTEAKAACREAGAAGDTSAQAGEPPSGLDSTRLERLLTEAAAESGTQRRVTLGQLAFAVCRNPVACEAWADRVVEQRLASRRAFLEQVDEARQALEDEARRAYWPTLAEAREVVAAAVESARGGDVGAPLVREALRALLVLQQQALPDYANIRQELKKAGVSLRDLNRALNETATRQRAEEAAAVDPGDRFGDYFVLNGRICHEQDTNQGPVVVPLCNFAAGITGEEIRDDGSSETTTFFDIEGALDTGAPLPKVSIPSVQFGGMSWVTSKWGTRPVVYAGISIRDHLRVAIQLRSGEVPRRTVYGHTGWRRIGEEWLYLYSGGALGTVGTRTDIEVSLGDGKLADFRLPDPPTGEELAAAVRASLDLLSLSRAETMYSLLAAVYRAPLGETLPIDLSLFLVGPTGSQKSELTALAQAHYGAGFHRKNLPGNWSSSVNTLEKEAFLIKDSLFTVDDFAPGGTSADVQRLHQQADRLFRAQGNRTGRGRMRPDGTLRPEYYPRGLILSSGEDVPVGHSVRARLVTLEVAKGDVDLKKLTVAQNTAAAGLYAAAMAGYLAWLAPQMDTLKETLPNRQRELRDHARGQISGHDRTPENLASLALGLELLLRFAVESGALDEAESVAHWRAGWQALTTAARLQGSLQASEEPTRRFLTLLSAVLASGNGHVAAADNGREPADPGRWGWREKESGSGDSFSREWQFYGPRIGWLDGEDLFLEPDATYAAIQRMAQAQGSSFPTTQQTLWKRLAEKGLLASRDEARQRNTVRRTVAGARREVIHLHAETLSAETVPTVPTSPMATPQARDWDGFEGRFSEDDAETVPENCPTAAPCRHADTDEGTNGTVGTVSVEDPHHETEEGVNGAGHPPAGGAVRSLFGDGEEGAVPAAFR